MQTFWKKFLPSLLAVCLILSTQIAALALDLVPVGKAVGLEMQLDGVMVAGISPTEQGSSPAGDAGVIVGDMILAVNDAPVDSGAALLQQLARWDGGSITLRIRRADREQDIELTPAAGENGACLGLLLRDTIAGIGTITYYDPESGQYGALGHGVTEGTTGLLLPLEDGVVLGASVAEVQAGQAGTPGALQGEFDAEDIQGDIQKNTNAGIFGNLTTAPAGQTVPVAAEAEIHAGDAEILCNVSGTDIQRFSIQISRVTKDDATGRTMQLKVTDPTLLSITGGIVQGMSGSPILQDGKLIGAVTHVLVDDPTRGYGISMEDMLTTAAA